MAKTKNGINEAIEWLKKSLDRHEKIIEKQDEKLNRILSLLNKNDTETSNIKQLLNNHIVGHKEEVCGVARKEVETELDKRKFETYKIAGITATIMGVIVAIVQLLININF